MLEHSETSTRALYFNRYIASFNVQGDPAFLDFLATVQPQVVQMGYYGPQVYALADAAADAKQWAGGYPMGMPVRGLRTILEWQAEFNRKVHDLGAKVVGHFSMTVAWGDPEQDTGFTDFFNRYWPTDLLGEKTVDSPLDFVQKNADGSPIIGDRWGFPRLAGCSNNPHWRALQHRMVQVALEVCDIDGFMTNYNYDYGCACEYCNEAFKGYLVAHYTPTELQQVLGIEDLTTFRLDGTLKKVSGWVDADNPHNTRLQVEGMRFAQIAWKKHFDELFVNTGRRLKADLILGAWNHLGPMKMGQDERNVMPQKLWGRDEDLFWYSTGGRVGSVAGGDAGMHMLNSKWIWEMSGHKLPVLGHYESTRVRASMAEGLAVQGPGMGLYCGWQDPVGYKAYQDYFEFVRQYDAYFHPVESHAEVGLVFPRQAVHAGNDAPVKNFHQLGVTMLNIHTIFDILADNNFSTERLSAYAVIILPDAESLTREHWILLAAWVKTGGVLVFACEAATGLAALALAADAKQWTLGKGIVLTADAYNAQSIVPILASVERLSSFTAPWMVRVNGWAQPGRILLHLVNYNRVEDKDKGPVDEKPIAVEDIAINLFLPFATKVTRVDFISPDVKEEAENSTEINLEFVQHNNRVKCQVPWLLIYGIVVVHY